MNDTERLYEITKLTKSALTTVEKGWTPYGEYRKIVSIIESNTKYATWEKFKRDVKYFLKILAFIISCATTVCYGFRAFGLFMMTESFMPGFGYVLIGSLACSIAVVFYNDLWG